MKNKKAAHVDSNSQSGELATGGANEMARAFRAGWATGFQECAEGAVLEHGETDRPALETAALERWLAVNGRLIAVEPDLLAALKELVAEFEFVCGDGVELAPPPPLKHARATIAKAEGR